MNISQCYGFLEEFSLQFYYRHLRTCRHPASRASSPPHPPSSTIQHMMIMLNGNKLHSKKRFHFSNSPTQSSSSSEMPFAEGLSALQESADYYCNQHQQHCDGAEQNRLLCRVLHFSRCVASFCVICKSRSEPPGSRNRFNETDFYCRE